MGKNESVIYANFGDARTRDRDLRNQKPVKKTISFLSRNFIYLKIQLTGQLAER